MKKAVYCSVILLLAFAGSVYSQRSAELKWMTGTWKIETGNGTIIEQWQTGNDSTLTGRNVFVKNGTDTIPQESIELAYRNGYWYYVPTVSSQNNTQPVKFKIILLKGTEFISENPLHDFPQRIVYRRIRQQLFASIEGKKNGRYGKQNFDFTAQ